MRVGAVPRTAVAMVQATNRESAAEVAPVVPTMAAPVALTKWTVIKMRTIKMVVVSVEDMGEVTVMTGTFVNVGALCQNAAVHRVPVWEGVMMMVET